MSGLTIHGRHGSDTWIERDGDILCLDRADINHLNRWVTEHGIGTIAGITFDESDLIELTNAPHLFDCADCEGPGLLTIEGRLVCPGHAAGFGATEEASA